MSWLTIEYFLIRRESRIFPFTKPRNYSSSSTSFWKILIQISFAAIFSVFFAFIAIVVTVKLIIVLPFCPIWNWICSTAVFEFLRKTCSIKKISCFLFLKNKAGKGFELMIWIRTSDFCLPVRFTWYRVSYETWKLVNSLKCLLP